MSDQEPPTLKELYPHLNDEELAEAGERLDAYLKLALRIYERLHPEE